MLGFQSFQSANKTLKGIEAMNMIKKGQVNYLITLFLMKSNMLINYLV